MRTFTLRACANQTATGLLLGFVVFSSGSLAGILRAQSPVEFERFEVASIRPSSKGVRPSMQFTPGGVRATNVTLKMLIQLAYEIQAEQVTGGPGWADSEEYTVIAKAPDGDPSLSAAEQKALTLKRLRALLSERFQLLLKQESTLASGIRADSRKVRPQDERCQ
jgi:hypothetical protein